MLCEKCGQREAHVKITKIINGVSESHNYCRQCAEEVTGKNKTGAAEWSGALVKFLTEMFMQASPANSEEMTEKAEGLVCPTCRKTYREFAENGVFGCDDCYEVFEPMLGPALISMQGIAAHHHGSTHRKETVSGTAPDPFAEETLSDEEELRVLEAKLQEAVRLEDYQAAARYRDEISARREKKNG